jgi:predicted DNA-binding protein (MmcQ/YjbR family)
MNLARYNAFCAALPHTSHVVQWGGAHVWKVGGAKGKVFAIAQMSFDLLKEQPGVRPAPYLASRGMLWLQRTDPRSMDDAALCDYIGASHRLAAANLPKGMRDKLKL